MTDNKEAEFKYGVADLATACGITPAYTRVWLRSQQVAKAGRSYGWKTKAEVEALAKEYKAAGPVEKAPKAEKAKPAAKAAPKAAVKAAPKAKPAAKAAEAA